MSKAAWLVLLATVAICQGHEAAPAEHGEGHATEGAGNATNATHGAHAAGHGAGHHESGADLALVLLGGVAFLMTIFYLVNGPRDIAKHSWSMISTTVSIFSAVMTFGLVNNILKDCFGLPDVEPPVLPTMKNVWNSLFQIMCWWLLCCFVLTLQRGSPIRLKGYGTIFGHILGFSAIHLYTHVANLDGFHGKPSMTFLVIVIYIFTIPIVALPTRFLAKFAVQFKVEDVEELHEQAKDTGSDFFAMGLSFLICMWIRALITVQPEHAVHAAVHAVGEAVPAAVHAVGEAVAATGEHHARRLSHHAVTYTAAQVRWLVFAGAIFIVLGTLVAIAHHKIARLQKMSMDVVSTTVALTGAWCMLNAANWHFTSRFKSHTAAHIGVAVFFSVVFVFAVLLVHLIIEVLGAQKRMMRSFFTAVSLAMGLSWEHLFDGALDSVKDGGEVSKEGGKWLHIFATLVLVMVVTPAWMVYILPQHDEELIEAKKAAEEAAEKNGVELGPLPIWACCCGDYEIEAGGEDESEEDVE